MSKLKQLKEAMANTPPQRLARIEYQSHIFQMIGIAAVCAILIFKGFWFIIFAFIFGLGISYAQGMTAYKKYRNISMLVEPEKPENYEGDISFTRRRSKIIEHVYGTTPKWTTIIISVIMSTIVIPLDSARALLILGFLILIPTFYFIFYFGFFYWIAYPMYKSEMKIK